MGLRVRAAWERFSRLAPAVIRAAEDYGTSECELDGALLEEWKAGAEEGVGSQGRSGLEADGEGAVQV